MKKKLLGESVGLGGLPGAPSEASRSRLDAKLLLPRPLRKPPAGPLLVKPFFSPSPLRTLRTIATLDAVGNNERAEPPACHDCAVPAMHNARIVYS